MNNIREKNVYPSLVPMCSFPLAVPKGLGTSCVLCMSFGDVMKFRAKLIERKVNACAVITHRVVM